MTAVLEEGELDEAAGTSLPATDKAEEGELDVAAMDTSVAAGQ